MLLIPQKSFDLRLTSVPNRLFNASFHILAEYAGCNLVHIDMTEITCKENMPFRIRFPFTQIWTNKLNNTKKDMLT